MAEEENKRALGGGDLWEDSEDVMVLDPKLRAERREAAPREQLSDVKEERSADPLVINASNRNRARLLVVTTDESVFEEGSVAEHQMLEFESMFAEVHVLVLNLVGKKRPKEVRRISDGVWAYPTNSEKWWHRLFDAGKVVREQLEFKEGFRPDLVLAVDPFEAGVAGLWIAKKHDRSFQVHVRTDFFDPRFKKEAPHNGWRVFMAGYVLKRAACIRTTSDYLQRKVAEEFEEVAEVAESLPIFYDIESWQNKEVTFSIKEKYPQFRFVLLHLSRMNEFSHTEAVIDGLYYILRQYPTIGLVILGDGPLREELEERIKRYQLQSQIVFLAPEIDVVSCLRSSDVLIHTSEERRDDEAVLQAVTLDVPIIAGARGAAEELLEDGESVLLCPLDSPPCFGEKANELLNKNELREKLAIGARQMVVGNIEQDYGTYLAAYQQSIEKCILGEEAEEEKEVPSEEELKMPEEV